MTKLPVTHAQEPRTRAGFFIGARAVGSVKRLDLLHGPLCLCSGDQGEGPRHPPGSKRANLPTQVQGLVAPEGYVP